VRAVHQSQIGLANEYTEFVKKMSSNVVCAPDLPIEVFEPLCLNRQCKDVIRSYLFLLEVPEQPVASQPFWIGMSFRFPMDAEWVDAKFILPDTVRVIRRRNTLSKALIKQEDIMKAQLIANKNFKSRTFVMNFMFALLLAACAPSASTTSTPAVTPQPANHIEENLTPVILKVVDLPFIITIYSISRS